MAYLRILPENISLSLAFLLCQRDSLHLLLSGQIPLCIQRGSLFGNKDVDERFIDYDI